MPGFGFLAVDGLARHVLEADSFLGLTGDSDALILQLRLNNRLQDATSLIIARLFIRLLELRLELVHLTLGPLVLVELADLDDLVELAAIFDFLKLVLVELLKE